MCWRLVLTLLAATSAQNAPTQVNEFIYGKVRTDGIEYASFDVRPGTAQVVITFARSELHGRVPPVLLLKHGGLPTTTDYDVRFNGTSESYWLTQTIPDLRLGRYFIAVWGGALESSIMDFGIGPTINVWYHIVLQSQGCLDTTHLGSECAYFAWPLVSFAPEETSSVVNAAQVVSTALPSASGCFDPNQFIALYALALSPEASFAVDISLSKAPGTPQSFFYALYQDRANPLDASTTAYMIGQGALGRRTYRMNVVSPPEGVWYLLLYLDTPDMTLCSNARGTKFNVTYSVQGCSTSLTTVNDCNTNWVQLDEIIYNPTRSLSAVDRWYMASNPMVTVPVTKSTYGVGYTMRLTPDMAGTNLRFHAIVPATLPVASLVMLVGVDEYPSEARYAYRLDGAHADVTSGVSSSVGSALTSESTFVHDEVAAANLNGSVTLSWAPLRFPPVGTWYIAVQTTQSTPWTQGLVVQAQGCSDNMCGDSGSCVAQATYQGLVYSRCVCEYGHAGPFCDQVVIVEEQWHGWFLVVTNVAIVPTTVAATRRHLHVEAVLFGSLGIASSLYHACDLNWFCALPFSTLMSLDFGLSFNSILLCVFHLSGVSPRAKAMAQVVGIVMLIVLLAINPTAPINLVFVGCLGAGQLLVAWTGYFVIAAYRTRWRVSFYTIGKLFVFNSDNFNLKMVSLGLVLWLGALLCWFFNSSSPSYWLLHSLWHLFAMSAAGAFIAAKRASTYRIIDSNGADLLRALPEAKPSMRNVLVAPVPTISSESLKETSSSCIVILDP